MPESKIGDDNRPNIGNIPEEAANPSPDLTGKHTKSEHPTFLGVHELKAKESTKSISVAEGKELAKKLYEGIDPAQRDAAQKKFNSIEPGAQFIPRAYTDWEKKVIHNLEDKLFNRKFAPLRANRASEHAKLGEAWSPSTKSDGLLKTAEKNYIDLKDRVLQKKDANPNSDVTQKIGRGQITFNLTGDERLLLENIVNANFYLTHSTRQDLQSNVQVQIHAKSGQILKDQAGQPEPLLDGDAKPVKKETFTVSSRKRLVAQNKLPAEAEDNTTKADIEAFSTVGYSFFSLEAGDHLQKLSSRFGKGGDGRIYRIKVDDDIPLKGGVLLTHDIIYGPKTIYSADQLFDLPGIKSNQKLFEANQSFSPDEFAYPADKLKLAIGLLLVEKVRQLNPDQQNKILDLTKSDSGVNSIINGMFRPQILIPETFSKSDFAVTELEDSRTLSEIKAELVKAKNDLDADNSINSQGHYKEAVNDLYVRAKGIIASEKKAAFDQDEERDLLFELENHLAVIPQRDIEVLWVKHIKRAVFRNPPKDTSKYHQEIIFNQTEFYRNNLLNQSKLDAAIKEEILTVCFGKIPKPSDLLLELNEASIQKNGVKINQIFKKIEMNVFDNYTFPAFDEAVELSLLQELDKHVKEITEYRLANAWHGFVKRALNNQTKEEIASKQSWLYQQIESSCLKKGNKRMLVEIIKDKLRGAL